MWSVDRALMNQWSGLLSLHSYLVYVYIPFIGYITVDNQPYTLRRNKHN